MMTHCSAAAIVVFCATASALARQSLASKGEAARRLLITSPVLTFSGTTARDAETSSFWFEEKFIQALQADEHVTVVGDIQFGKLDCEILEATEDADVLQIATSPSETILAQKTSFTYIGGDSFEDGIPRQVWVGQEVVDDILDPRRIVTITWGKVCDVETFLLEVTSPGPAGGALSITKSLPCVPGKTVDLCVVEVEVSPMEEDEPESVSKGDRGQNRVLVGQTGSPLSAAGKVMTDSGRASPGERHLQSTTTIDVMYLYTQEAKDLLGGISDAQMQTTLATAVATSNDATSNSDIDLTFSLVYVGQLPYEETSTSSSTILYNLSTDEDVADLRDTHDADLVQMAGRVGYYSCGTANLFSGSSADGFSAVNPLCFSYFTHNHEIGHNLGCYHNRDNSNAQTGFAHGYRYCDSTDPYRTIMSSFCTNNYTIPRINWFSNPEVVALDKATGTNDDDCARAIEENMSTVADFRPSV